MSLDNAVCEHFAKLACPRWMAGVEVYKNVSDKRRNPNGLRNIIRNLLMKLEPLPSGERIVHALFD